MKTNRVDSQQFLFLYEISIFYSYLLGPKRLFPGHHERFWQ